MFLKEARNGAGRTGVDGGIGEREDGGRTSPGVEGRCGRYSMNTHGKFRESKVDQDGSEERCCGDW